MSYASEYYGGGGGGAGEASPVDVAGAAANPKAASGDGVSMTAHSLPDLIAADKYERAKAAGRSKSRGIRFARFVPPGTTSSNEDAR
jgi:hypothetical protein